MKNNKGKIIKLIIFILWIKIMRFHVDCRLQIRIVSVQSVSPVDQDQWAVDCLF